MSDHAFTIDHQGESEEKRQSRIENIAGTIAIRYTKAQAAQIIYEYIFTTGGGDLIEMMASVGAYLGHNHDRDSAVLELKIRLGEIIDKAAEDEAACIVGSGDTHDSEDDRWGDAA